MSRSIVLVSLACGVVALAPFTLAACDALGKKDAPDAAVAVPVVPATPAVPAAPATPDPVQTTPVAPLGGPVTPTPGGVVKPAVTDGGKPAVAADGGAVADGGKATPGAAPTPTLAIPTAIPGFDAGGFKPPPGFPTAIPTTLPTFPPPAK